MGVDHSAFVCFGRPVRSLGTFTDSDEARTVIGKQCDIVEWGSTNYGGLGGFIVAYRDAYEVINLDDGYKRWDKSKVNDVHLMEAVINRAIVQLGVEPDGEADWHIGGRTWYRPVLR